MFVFPFFYAMTLPGAARGTAGLSHAADFKDHCFPGYAGPGRLRADGADFKDHCFRRRYTPKNTQF